jgi:alpha-N-arabinofuranosidase
MYSTAHATHPVTVQTDGGTYSVQHGVGRLPQIADVPYLDVAAALNDAGDTLTVFCVNRSLNTDIPANVTVSGFAAHGAAQVQTLRAGSLDEGNDEDEPARVVPVQTQEATKAGGLRHVFPHESVTVITLKK